MTDLNFDYSVLLMQDEYKDTIRSLKRGEHFQSFVEEGYTGIKLNDKIVLIRFKPGEDIIATPPRANPKEVFYQTADIPQEYKQLGKPIKELHFSTPQELQEFFNKLSAFQKGELPINE